MKSDGFFSLKLRNTTLFKKFGALYGKNASPISTVFFGLLCVVTPIALCFIFVGPQTILEYASKSQPYSVLLSPSSYSAFAQDEDSIKLVCFGDSNYFYPPHETPKKGDIETYLPTMLDKDINNRAGLGEVIVSHRAFPSAGMFDYYCMIYEAVKFSPDLIIVPINWRSFGINEWDTFGVDWLEGSSWFHPQLSALAPLRAELPPDEDPVRGRGISMTKQLEYKLSLYTLYPIGMKSWALENAKSLFATFRESVDPSAFAEVVEQEPENGGTALLQPNPARAKELSGTFPMKIEESNPTFRSLAPLARVASNRGIKVLFFIWPLDQEFLEERGHLDKASLEQSIDLIADAVDQENIYFLDLSDLLGHEYFFDIVGHCTVDGRQKVARALAPKIAEILSEGSGPSQ